jgi:hypothetical protein
MNRSLFTFEQETGTEICLATDLLTNGKSFY